RADAARVEQIGAPAECQPVQLPLDLVLRARTELRPRRARERGQPLGLQRQPARERGARRLRDREQPCCLAHGRTLLEPPEGPRRTATACHSAPSGAGKSAGAAPSETST